MIDESSMRGLPWEYITNCQFLAPPQSRARWLCCRLGLWLLSGVLHLFIATFAFAQDPDLHGLVEIGGSDIKSVVLQLTQTEVERVERAFNEREEPMKFRLIDNAIKHTLDDLKLSAARPENISKVIEGVHQTIERMKAEFSVPPERIYVVASSGVAATPHYGDLRAQLQQHLPGVVLSQVTAETECQLTYRWITPRPRYREVVIIDVGSSNVKACYVDYLGKHEQPIIRGFELLPIGTKTFADRVRDRLRDRGLSSAKFLEIAQELRRGEIRQAIDQVSRNNPGLSSLPRVYLAGGIVWATSNLTRPCPSDPYWATFRPTDITLFANRLKAGRSFYYDRACANNKPDQLAKMEAVVSSIRRTFTPEDLIAGNELMQAMAEQLRFDERRAIFFAPVARDSWRSQLLADNIRANTDTLQDPRPFNSMIVDEIARRISEEMRQIGLVITARLDEKLIRLDEERKRLGDERRRLDEDRAQFERLVRSGREVQQTSTVDKPIKIGVAGPMSGPSKADGDHIVLGVQEAIADINAAGGINGQRLEAIIKDDKGDATRGVVVAKELAEAGVKIVIGHINSDVTLPASAVYADNDILMITPASTNVQITDEKRWNVFRTCGRDDQQGEVAGKYIAENLIGKKIAVLHDGSLYGKGLADATRGTMHKLGQKEVLYDSVAPNSPNMPETVSKLKKSGAEVVYWGGDYYGGGQLIREMQKSGINAVMMSGDGITDDEFARIGGPRVEGTLMTYHPDPEKRPEAKAVVARLHEKKSKTGVFTYYSYAAVQIAAAAANEAKTFDVKKIAETIRGAKSWQTIIGPIAYDDKGDITRSDYVMYSWKKR